MMNTKYMCRYLVAFALVATNLFLVRSVRAELGARETAIEDTRIKVKASLKKKDTGVGPCSACTVHTLEADANTIREYVSPDGMVFGVAWAGISHPDFNALLGIHAESYKKANAKKKTPGVKTSFTHKTDQVVVEHWGHPRNLQGRAYEPANLPEGVTPEMIK